MISATPRKIVRGGLSIAEIERRTEPPRDWSCSRCDVTDLTIAQAEDHLVFAHAIARETARELLVRVAHSRLSLSTTTTKEKNDHRAATESVMGRPEVIMTGFQVGDRVRGTAELAKSRPRTPANRVGTVRIVRRHHGIVEISVRWDGRASDDALHPAYLELVERPNGMPSAETLRERIEAIAATIRSQGR